MSARHLLVTAALPYVNGQIHLGHLVEYIQADIWVRFQRLCGHQVAFICADDTHGTATMIRARQEGRSEQAVITEMSATHQRDFAAFGVDFSHYGSTDSASNRRLVSEIWSALQGIPGVVIKHEVTQLFDAQVGCFLADRFVKGTCPNCQSTDQYGDSCDKCNSTYSPTELINPKSTLSGSVPELRSAQHIFVRLEPLRAGVEAWINGTPAPLQSETANWLKGTFLAPGMPLRDWDVSRPAPYFGFEIPGEPGQFFYVWVDAPVGYLASLTDALAAGTVAGTVSDWWPKHGETGYNHPDRQVHHFIGKDITYFHTVFWPAMLACAGYQLPTQVHVHGFLTVDGEKMSKSKGTFIQARTYLDTISEPAYLRYYFATKLTRKIEDIDLNLVEFAEKVNSDLIGKVVNLASRCANFIAASGLAADLEGIEDPDGQTLLAACADAQADIATLYQAGDYSEAMRRVMTLADQANAYVAKTEPWKLAKDPDHAVRLRHVCTVVLNVFWRLCVFLAPVLPTLAVDVGELFHDPISHWDAYGRVQVNKKIRPFQHLLSRVDSAKVSAMVDAAKIPEPEPIASTSPTPSAATPTTAPAAAAEIEALLPTVSFEDFAKIDLRVAQILSAEEVPKAKKIIRLTVSLGGPDPVVIFAGIRSAYPQASALVGRLIVVVANLAPRQMSFGLSQGMAVAAGPGGQDIFLLSPDSGAKPGQRVH